MRGRLAGIAVIATALIATGCGDDDSTSTTDQPFRPGKVIGIDAPTSVEIPLSSYIAKEGLATQISYAGSDFHAGQVRDGLKPDLILADSADLLTGLYVDGLVAAPVELATDELVVAVPKDSGIHSVDDLADAGVTVSIGKEGVPAGDYARDAISALDPDTGDAILANATDEQTNNNGIVVALTGGKADAGFVYASDVRAHPARLRQIELPEDAKQQVVIAGSVIPGSPNQAGGQHVLDGLSTGSGAREFERAGFGPPPDGS